MAKPTKFPRWASSDIVDPVSGVNNVVEPSEAKKDLGHGPLGEYPPRQYQNWFMRLVYQWIVWLKEQVTDVLPVKNGVFEAKVDTGDFTTGQTFDLEWQKHGDVITVLFPGLSKISNSAMIRIKPSGASNWPDELLAPSNIDAPFHCLNNNTENRIGIIELPVTGTSSMQPSFSNTSGQLSSTGFTASGNKGWFAQSITYSTK